MIVYDAETFDFVRYIICADGPSSREYVGDIWYIGDSGGVKLHNDIIEAKMYALESTANDWMKFLERSHAYYDDISKRIKGKKLSVLPVDVRYRVHATGKEVCT